MSFLPRPKLQTQFTLLPECRARQMGENWIHKDLLCFKNSTYVHVHYCHDEWYLRRRRKPDITVAPYQFNCETQKFNAKAESQMMRFNMHAATYSEEDAASLGLPPSNVFNCIGLEDFGEVVDFWKLEEGPELLRIVSTRALKHVVDFWEADDPCGMFAFVCDQGVCRSVAVALTLLVAAERIKPWEIGYAGEYLLHDKSSSNKESVKRGVFRRSGPAILEAAALMGPIFLPL
jgi:hypothetical protein